MTPMKIAIGTRSTGAVLLFWFAGVLYALAGMHVYIEFGLNVPRFFYKGRERSVARSGGELNYVSRGREISQAEYVPMTPDGSNIY